MKERIGCQILLILGMAPINVGASLAVLEAERMFVQNLEVLLGWTIVFSALAIAARIADKMTTIKGTELANRMTSQGIQHGYYETNVFYSKTPTRQELLSGKGLVLDSFAVAIGSINPAIAAPVVTASCIATINNLAVIKEMKRKLKEV